MLFKPHLPLPGALLARGEMQRLLEENPMFSSQKLDKLPSTAPAKQVEKHSTANTVFAVVFKHDFTGSLANELLDKVAKDTKLANDEKEFLLACIHNRSSNPYQYNENKHTVSGRMIDAKKLDAEFKLASDNAEKSVNFNVSAYLKNHAVDPRQFNVVFYTGLLYPKLIEDYINANHASMVAADIDPIFKIFHRYDLNFSRILPLLINKCGHLLSLEQLNYQGLADIRFLLDILDNDDALTMMMNNVQLFRVTLDVMLGTVLHNDHVHIDDLKNFVDRLIVLQTYFERNGLFYVDLPKTNIFHSAKTFNDYVVHIKKELAQLAVAQTAVPSVKELVHEIMGEVFDKHKPWIESHVLYKSYPEEITRLKNQLRPLRDAKAVTAEDQKAIFEKVFKEIELGYRPHGHEKRRPSVNDFFNKYHAKLAELKKHESTMKPAF